MMHLTIQAVHERGDVGLRIRCHEYGNGHLIRLLRESELVLRDRDHGRGLDQRYWMLDQHFPRRESTLVVK